ncbi:hypothetical protein SAMN05216464_11358 [Mucilaginibacter pineti]|uniref:Nucleotidyltransferase n=1 Tax=Mucilaginibacter pineti TaxID=1391627 RepID=A0A1G7IJJ4_9SPHI|nr:hypothetical protein [Mucilaginibacter pineti]SDF12930.1 hypothetical protein SAMN05216464_11358 [Mucilaginibacter pineti]
MDYLKINFDELRFGGMKETIDALERAFQKFEIDFYLIGAFARDIWMNHLDHLPTRRTTYDIDFSIYIHKIEQFQELKDYLEQVEGFKRTDEPYRLLSPDQTIVDLIPFGGVEQNNMVYLEGHPPMDLSVFGNMQVLAHAKTIIANGSEFKVCTLAGLCILKLVAGNERAERFEKDMGDFYYILVNYMEIAGDTLFDVEHEDLIDEDFEPQIAAVKILARQMVPILKESLELQERIFAIFFKLKEGFDDREINEMHELEPQDKKIRRLKLVSSLNDELKSQL